MSAENTKQRMTTGVYLMVGLQKPNAAAHANSLAAKHVVANGRNPKGRCQSVKRKRIQPVAKMRVLGSATKLNAKPRSRGNVLHANAPSLAKSLPVAGAIITRGVYLASIQPAPHVVSRDHAKTRLSKRDTRTRQESGTVSHNAGPKADEPFNPDGG